MNLDKFLAEAWTASPPTGTLGKETEWFDFCELHLPTGDLLIVDASYAPSADDGLRVKLPKDTYLLQAKVMDYGTDKRIARLRVCKAGTTPKVGPQIGTTWTDTGMTGLCDYGVFTPLWSHDKCAVIEPFIEAASTHGIAILNAAKNAIMPFVFSGFGDGEFPVHGLLQGSSRIGIEIVFISSNEPYPF